jgi:hypothetical protein
MLVSLMAMLNILQQLDIFYGPLAYFLDIFLHISPVWVCRAKKNLATLLLGESDDGSIQSKFHTSAHRWK